MLLVLATGAHLVSGLGGLAVSLYGWVPILSGVATSVAPIRGGSLRDAVRLAVVAGVLMVALDTAGAYGGDRLRLQWAYRGGEYEEMVDKTAAARTSWVATGTAWIAGELGDVGERRPSYPESHPRNLASSALNELGLLLLALALPVIVLAVGWWTHRHVRFDRPAHELAARVVLGWLISGAFVFVAASAAAQQQVRAFFRGGSLGSVIVPFVLLFLVGMVAAWLVAGWERSSPQEMES